MHFRYQSGPQTAEIMLERVDRGFQAVVNGQAFEVEILDRQPGVLSLRISGQPLTFHWAQNGSRKWVAQGGCTYFLDPPTPRGNGTTGEMEGSAAVRAPMPAQVMAVHVASGETVERGQVLLLLEAMKMEIQIMAPTAGKALRVLAGVGQTVDRDQLLVEIGG